MFNFKDFNSAIAQIAEEKGIAKEKVLETIEQAIAAAYKKEYGTKNEVIRAKMDEESGEVKFWQVKTVVDQSMLKEETEEGEEEIKEESSEKNIKKDEEEEKPKRKKIIKEEEKEELIGEDGEIKKIRFNEERHIMIDDAKKIDSDVVIGGEVIFPLEAKEEFGRIAAQTAKQVILQRLREAERGAVMGEFKEKEGEIISGVIQRIERRNVFVNLGRTQGVMFYNESIPGERYRIGERMKFFILAVQEDARGPMIVLSRTHPKFIIKLFELEVPEIATGTVKIMAIAREAGGRTKLAVSSSTEGIDPVGSCVGQKGTRVMAVLNELGQEKMDIIKWDEDPEKFIAQAVSPAKVSRVEVSPRREAIIFVPEDQLSLAIGRGGQNVRLAARLTGWKIDVRSESAPEQTVEGGVAVAEEEKIENENEALTPQDETPEVGVSTSKDIKKEKVVKEKNTDEASN
jgi:transcription termination/antitermination protein NusA